MVEEMLPDLERCGLCLADVDLRNSHLIPRFVVRWIQETSATGLILSPTAAGRPLQDSPTRKMFCATCEEILSVDEKAFAEQVFRPRHEAGDRWRGFNYEPWLSRFIAGLMLKAALSHAPEWAARKFENAVLPSLRRYLQRSSPWPVPYEMHLVFTTYLPVEQLPDAISRNIQWYVMRGTDLTAATSSQRSCYLYASIPGFQFWMPITPVHPKGWQGTQVSLGGSFPRPSRQSVGIPNWLDFMNDRATAIQAMIQGTPSQEASRTRRFERNAERAMSSESLTAWLNSPPSS